MVSDCFYYGVYSPKGFYSLTEKPSFCAEKNYVVKGYSRYAKQKLFTLIKCELGKRGQDYTDFRADERSIGVFSEGADLKITDGTYGELPHEGEVLLLDSPEESDAFRHVLFKRNEAVQRVQRFLAVCKSISNDMVRLDMPNINYPKINRFSSQLWSSTGGTLKGTVGTEHKRFVSCFTADGTELNPEAFDIYCERVTLICERSGACARQITDRVRSYALSAGYDVITCLCPLNPEAGAEHLIIPELKCGFFTNKYFHKCEFKNCRRVCAGRFLNDSAAATKNRMDFSLKAYKRLMKEVFASIKAVNKCDEELETFISRYESDKGIENILQKVFSS